MKILQHFGAVNMENKKEGRSTHSAMLVLGSVALFYAGTIFAWPLLNEPFRIVTDMNVTNSSLLLVNFALLIVFFSLGALCSSFIAKKITARLRLILSGLLVIAGFYTSSLFVTMLADFGNYFLLFAAYSLLGGLGAGVAYNTIVSTVIKWYHDVQWLTLGILVLCFGLGVGVIGNLATIMGQSVDIDWRNTYIIMAFVVGGVLLITALLLRPRSAYRGFSEVKFSKLNFIPAVLVAGAIGFFGTSIIGFVVMFAIILVLAVVVYFIMLSRGKKQEEEIE